jgi:hypothetical protein
MRILVKHLLTVALVACVTIPAAAQQPAPAPAPAPRAQPAPRVQAAAPAPAPGTAPRAPLPFANEPITVRYDVIIREEGGAQPSVKTVSMTATLYEVSLVRASSRNPLNVDVNPTGLRDTKVRTKIGIEYTPVMPETPSGPAPVALAIRQAVHVWLESGKPMLVSQSADPASNRRLTVEVTATILK